MEFYIKKENTAITNGISESSKYISKLKNIENKKILDYGCGKLRNSIYLYKFSKHISILDSKEQINNCNLSDISLYENIYYIGDVIYDKYDIVLCSFVLNVIYDIYERIDVIKNIESILKNNGIAVIEVRGEKSLNNVKYKKTYLDGYLIGKNTIKTFQKNYTQTEILEFIQAHSDLKILKSYKKNDSIICILSKKED